LNPRPSGYEPESGASPEQAKRVKSLLRGHFGFASFRVLHRPIALSCAMDVRWPGWKAGIQLAPPAKGCLTESVDFVSGQGEGEGFGVGGCLVTVLGAGDGQHDRVFDQPAKGDLAWGLPVAAADLLKKSNDGLDGFQAFAPVPR